MAYEETNPDYLKRVIFDLLFFRRSSAAQTAWFRDKKHNNDLVPAVELKVNEIIDLFEKYHKITYDTQGIRDKGIDVLLRYQTNLKESEQKYIGFQIKSFDDITEKNWLSKLKAQVFDAFNAAKLEDLYILFCTDLIIHREQLRDLNSDFSRQKGLYVVRPEFVYEFLKLPNARIAAYLKTKLSTEDHVFTEAVKTLQDYDIARAAIVIELSTSYFLTGKSVFSTDEILNSSFIDFVYSTYPCLPIEYYEGEIDKADVEELIVTDDFPIANDLEALDSEVLFIDPTFDQIHILSENLLPVGAFVLDGNVRYGYEGNELKEYLLSTLLEDKINKAEDYMVWCADKKN